MTRDEFAALSDADLLRAAIAGTKDSRPGREGAKPAVVFAEDVARCNPRTLRRYLAGERVLPPLLREKCVEIAYTAARKEQRAATAGV